MNGLIRSLRRRAIVVAAAASALPGAGSAALPPPTPGAAPPAHGAAPPAAPQPQQVPWPVLMGLRSANVERHVPLIDRVVLVPDEATYLDEISRWSPFGHWPVLIDDDRFAPRFIRAFKPKVVLRRTDRAAALPPDAASRRTLMERTLVRCWGGDAERASLAQVYAALKLEPAGIVITNPLDPAWTAAMALAAGRGQLIGFIEGSWGSPSDVLDAATFARLAGAVNDIFRGAGTPYADLGDPLDACTLCFFSAAKCRPDFGAGAKFTAPGAPPVDPAEPLALTDCIGRHPDGRRFAIAASIWGDAARCAAMAMSSLFLDRSRFTFLNSYGEGGDLGPFGVAAIQERFEPDGYDVTIAIGQNATLRAWQRLGVGGLATDALFVNSSGDCFSFDLGPPGRTPAENHADALDVPVLNTPLALHFIHSFSLQHPNVPGTIGGRWLDHGVYAYVGSVQEPFVSAFVPPRDVMERLAIGVPFLVAARHYDGPFAVPWRIMTVGDPLMLAGPPAKSRRARTAPDAGEPKTLVEPGRRAVESVRDSAALALRACKEDPTPANFERAFGELERLGDDSIAGGLWPIATSKGVDAACARAALPALFRLRDTDAFLQAFRALPAPDEEALDMLWGMMTPRLSTLDRADDADLLARWPRAVRPQVDLLRLAPAMARLRGSAAARAMFLRAAEGAGDRATQEALRQAATAF